MPRAAIRRLVIQDQGNRSAGSGGCPPSLRNNRRRAASMSAWSARRVKKSAVFMAATFSATAGRHELIDARAVGLADLRNGRLERRGESQGIGAELFLHDASFLNASWGDSSAMPNRAGAPPKSLRLKVTRASATPLTAASRTISSAGSCRLWAPQEPGRNRLGDRAQRRDDGYYLGLAQARHDSLIPVAADRFVFQRQRHREQQRECTAQGVPEQCRGCAGRTPQAGDDDVGVQYAPHHIRYHVEGSEASIAAVSCVFREVMSAAAASAGQLPEGRCWDALVTTELFASTIDGNGFVGKACRRSSLGDSETRFLLSRLRVLRPQAWYWMRDVRRPVRIGRAGSRRRGQRCSASRRGHQSAPGFP